MPHLDHGDSLYEQRFISSFHDRFESVQYNTAFAITGTIRGSSREKIYRKLGFESLQQQRCCRKCCLFFKVVKNQSPKYLFISIPNARKAHKTRHKSNIPLFNVKHSDLKIISSLQL